MRLQGIGTIETADAYLDGSFLQLLQERHGVEPRDHVDGHRSRPSPATLALALSWQEARSVAKDWTVCWRNRRLQIDARHAALGLPGRSVVVVERRDSDGTLAILYGKRLLVFRVGPATAKPAQRKNYLTQKPHRMPTVPAANHPWRRHLLIHRSGFRPPPTSYISPFSGGTESKRTQQQNKDISNEP